MQEAGKMRPESLEGDKLRGDSSVKGGPHPPPAAPCVPAGLLPCSWGADSTHSQHRRGRTLGTALGHTDKVSRLTEHLAPCSRTGGRG